MVLTAVIVDDELHGRENLKKIIETYSPEIEILSVADSVLKGIELVNIHKPDVVFLDINMPVLDGFDFLNEFEDRNFMVVFVSAHEEFGIKALKAGASDYLLKPISIKELKVTVRKLLSLSEQSFRTPVPSQNEKLVLPASHGFDVLVIKDIIRVEADGCYSKVVVREGKSRIVSRTLKEFEDTLPEVSFFRIHKSHLINLNYIKEYSNLSGSIVTMTDGSRIEISRRKAPDFKLKIKTALKTV